MPIAKLNGFNINYKVFGNLQASNDHTIIFAHGNGNCLKNWRDLGYLEQFEAEGFRIIVMDALGYGASDKPLISTEYTAERRAADVIALMDYLGVDQCHFFGSSVGGSLGYVLAALYPERFLSFSIGMAHAYGNNKEPSNVHGDETKKLLAELPAEEFVQYYEKLLQRRFPEGVRKTFLNNNPQALIAANTITWPDNSSSLSKLNVPVLIFAGEHEEQLVPHIKTTAALIPDCTIKILQGRDHAEVYWGGKEVSSIVIEFIDRIS